MSDTIKKFENCSLLRNGKIVQDDLWIRGGKIINPEPLFFDEKLGPHQIIDCKGALIAPGLIDLQLNGGFGVDFSEDIVDRASAERCLTTVATGVLAHGVTSFCPTLVSSKPETYHKVLSCYHRRRGSKKNGANLLGMHLEGPFISPEKKGAHTLELLRNLNNGFEDIKATYGAKNLNKIDIVTLAPELDRTGTVVKQCRQNSIVVSLGHSIAQLHQGEAAVKQGATLITHLFNAMAKFHHRDPGLVGLITTNNLPNHKIYYGIIADGVHTSHATIKLAYKANFESMCLVTDGIGALGLQDGVYSLGEQTIKVTGLHAYVEGTDTLAGAIGTLWFAVTNLYNWSSCSLVDALQAASLHPAQALGIEQIKGTLNFGADADFIMIDTDKMEILSTWIDGSEVYTIDECI